jgi:hypothetical protein
MDTTITITIDEMIADLAARKKAYREAYDAYRKAEDDLSAAKIHLTGVLIGKVGYKLGDVVKTTDGREGRIRAFRMADDGTLVAICYGKTQKGEWSKSSACGLNITLRTA